MKYSWQRQIILETIQEHKEHLSAQQIYGYARERCPHISLGTVYRNLNTLADNDMIEIGRAHVWNSSHNRESRMPSSA